MDEDRDDVPQPHRRSTATGASDRCSPADALAALLIAILTINGWKRLAATTHMVVEP